MGEDGVKAGREGDVGLGGGEGREGGEEGGGGEHVGDEGEGWISEVPTRLFRPWVLRTYIRPWQASRANMARKKEYDPNGCYDDVVQGTRAEIASSDQEKKHVGSASFAKASARGRLRLGWINFC